MIEALYHAVPKLSLFHLPPTDSVLLRCDSVRPSSRHQGHGVISPGGRPLIRKLASSGAAGRERLPSEAPGGGGAERSHWPPPAGSALPARRPSGGGAAPRPPELGSELEGEVVCACAEQQ